MVTITGRKVSFRFFRPDAQEVHVVGDFEGWLDGRMPMQRGDDGHWELDVEMPSGVFRFQYHADNQRFADYAAFGVAPGETGMDSVLRVPVRELKMAA
jgi:1,4-alpha-glucan branching enzyme